MSALAVKMNSKLFHVLFLKDNEAKDVYIDEVKEVNFKEIKMHLEKGESVFIASLKERQS